MMNILLVGFDSAWTAHNRGAIVGVHSVGNGIVGDLGPPRNASYAEAEETILEWQARFAPAGTTIIMLDQPTIVRNASGQRPVENIVGSAVSRRYGGMQPANTAKKEMFGSEAPLWSFLGRFGGAANPLEPIGAGTRVFETYPVLTIVALGWLLPDSRAAGRLPKYNPARKKTFSQADWQYVCQRISKAFDRRGVQEIVRWLAAAGRKASPSKSDQDALDSCLCLIVALHLLERHECLMVGDLRSGYIVVPDSAGLRKELVARCEATQRIPSEWVQVFQCRSEISFPGAAQHVAPPAGD